MLSAWKGGTHEHISYIKHPNDQISDFRLYGLSLHTSGDAYYGVPVWVDNNPYFATLDTFISPNFIVPSLFKKIFADFKSLCNIFLECKLFNPLIICTI